MLDAALDRWRVAGQTARFWLRDDDAVDITPALETLLALTEAFETPLLMAVIPALAQPPLADRLDAFDRVLVAQHGYAHANQAAPGARACELGDDRGLEATLAELRQGADLLRSLFPRQTRPILVPPWNRISEAVVAALPTAGYRALSTFGDAHLNAAGLTVVNADLDVVDWKAGKVFRGESRLLATLVEALDAALPSGRAVGVMTHHRDHDEGCWTFLEDLFARTTAHPAARWTDADALIEGA